MKLKGDNEVVMAAVKQHAGGPSRGGALKHSSEKLKGDKEVVLAAVKQNGGGSEEGRVGKKRSTGGAPAAEKQNGGGPSRGRAWTH